MYVLDTNTLIYFFKGEGQVSDNLLKQSPKNVAIPLIVLFELEVGIAKSDSPKKRRAQLQTLVSAATLLPFDMKEAQVSAQIRAMLEKQGEPIGPYDTLIAGTAIANGGTLVTRNIQEFGRVPKLDLVDWY